MPVISVIVPVYNVEKYISMCIDSILAQTFKDFELLLIDDGSPDKSGEICDEYALKDSRVRVFHKENGGVCSARNLGLDNATGEWVTFIDADDWVSTGFIENLYNPILADNTIEFVQAGCTNYINDKIAEIEQKYEYLLNDNPVYLFNHFRGLTVSKLFNLNIIRTNELNFDEKMRIGEDMAFTLDYILHIKKYCFIPEVGYYYRYNPCSLTNTRKIKPYDNALSEFKHLFSSIQKYINKHQVAGNDVVFRKKQNASSLFNTFKCLYRNNYNIHERKSHLKNDFSEKELYVLSYLEVNIIDRFIILFYKWRFIGIFDILMSIRFKAIGLIR